MQRWSDNGVVLRSSDHPWSSYPWRTKRCCCISMVVIVISHPDHAHLALCECMHTRASWRWRWVHAQMCMSTACVNAVASASVMHACPCQCYACAVLGGIDLAHMAPSHPSHWTRCVATEPEVWKYFKYHSYSETNTKQHTSTQTTLATQSKTNTTQHISTHINTN
jgi:hypothetical protein